ncbi:glutamine synthetase family protein [Desulfitibacter alkalitolerans]|uniref:glutamine synthetase family protein n=1 Tax=Desulfitibacter alkalitolerans TaxID=264641 RepID=UPI0004866F61|nr:glutamine synthetase family protein [Desulfitibacter alkalitolerans]
MNQDTYEVLEKVKENNIKFIRLQFTDVFGRLKNIAVTVEDLEKVLNRQKRFDSSAVIGITENREADIVLYPDPDSLVIFPWRPREGAVARMLCDVYNPDGSIFELCSRSKLKKVVRESYEMGYDVKIGSEIEFFLFHTTADGTPTVKAHDQAGYCDLTPVDLGENARRDMVLTLEEMGFEIGSSHHENAPGQHEIVLKHDDPIEAADKIATFKFVVRTIAQRHGLHASFMPKPLIDTNGSALHLHHSIYNNEGDNIFFEKDAKWQLSKEALSYIKGILDHAGAITAFANPLINSYKRLSPSYVAPFYMGWSQTNRNTMIRVPSEREVGCRIELRSPDPACNPYTVLAASIKTGIDGIIKFQQGCSLPEPYESIDFKHYTNINTLEEHRNAILPRNLDRALQELRSDTLIKDTLGEGFVQLYLNAKGKEWERFNSFIHPWELDEYLIHV